MKWRGAGGVQTANRPQPVGQVHNNTPRPQLLYPDQVDAFKKAGDAIGGMVANAKTAWDRFGKKK